MTYSFLGRVRRTEVDGELVAVSLELIRDSDVVELSDGAEFVTLELEVDPFER